MEFNFNHPSIFVGNLDENVTDELLYRVFSQISKHVYCRIQRDLCGNSRGFAFVNYTNEADGRRSYRCLPLITFLAEKALRKLNYSKLLSKTIRLTWKVKDTAKMINEKANVFVKYLPKYMTDLDLFKMAEKFGKTVSVKVCLQIHNNFVS